MEGRARPLPGLTAGQCLRSTLLPLLVWGGLTPLISDFFFYIFIFPLCLSLSAYWCILLFSFSFFFPSVFRSKSAVVRPRSPPARESAGGRGELSPLAETSLRVCLLLFGEKRRSRYR